MRPYPTPDPRISAYVAEISIVGIPYVSRSHVTLLRLYDEHGKAVVEGLLNSYFKACRLWDYEKNKTWEGYCARRRAYNFTLQYTQETWERYVASKDYPEFRG